MLTQDNYTKENIERLQRISGNDPSLLEKTVYAFGLLEAISKVGMPFIFKGGTCLMLLLEKPRRLSTDIDIIVEPGTDVESFIQKAGQIFPFKSQKEDVRKGRNCVDKRHYEFTYNSPINDKPLVILLDILFEENHYKTLLEKPIKNDLLLTDGEDLTVRIPDVNSILGDKLTAFAPHTTGIPFGIDKELEIIKQLYDCYTLLREMTNYAEVREVYKSVAVTELGYRGMDHGINAVLRDTISSSFCIIAKGGIDKEEYTYFADGIRRIVGHIYSERFNGEMAAYIACEVLYLAACIYTDSEYVAIVSPEEYMNDKLCFKGARGINYLRKVNLECYAYVAAAVRLLGENVEEVVYSFEEYLEDKSLTTK
ncbi:MAG: nucleotidyl transferase AbiEii/AbiGii toxin family protein [Lachnospiraceae bacterium]|nr:nucleotidyl transferase AbiEii/AbiGii toxin family protein [Lachnospiraceae bacterium]MBR6151227.1 nucleotidyl transferase AbiEii/AbiGii toxin family protein [Lachnospiraceae bacterium]